MSYISILRSSPMCSGLAGDVFRASLMCSGSSPDAHRLVVLPVLRCPTPQGNPYPKVLPPWGMYNPMLLLIVGCPLSQGVLIPRVFGNVGYPISSDSGGNRMGPVLECLRIAFFLATPPSLRVSVFPITCDVPLS